VDPCPYSTIPAARIWIESEHAIAFAADAPAVDGHTIVVPKEHVPSIHAVPMAAQQGVWALVSEVRGRLRTAIVPGGGFSIGFVDGLTAGAPVPHTVIHVSPAPGGERGVAGVRRVDRE
jgi:histidine triad (HIT) family protein